MRPAVGLKPLFAFSEVMRTWRRRGDARRRRREEQGGLWAVRGPGPRRCCAGPKPLPERNQAKGPRGPRTATTWESGRRCGVASMSNCSTSRRASTPTKVARIWGMRHSGTPMPISSCTLRGEGRGAAGGRRRRGVRAGGRAPDCGRTGGFQLLSARWPRAGVRCGGGSAGGGGWGRTWGC
jgi:hypothetical protein